MMKGKTPTISAVRLLRIPLTDGIKPGLPSSVLVNHPTDAQKRAFRLFLGIVRVGGIMLPTNGLASTSRTAARFTGLGGAGAPAVLLECCLHRWSGMVATRVHWVAFCVVAVHRSAPVAVVSMF